MKLKQTLLFTENPPLFQVSYVRGMSGIDHDSMVELESSRVGDVIVTYLVEKQDERWERCPGKELRNYQRQKLAEEIAKKILESTHDVLLTQSKREAKKEIDKLREKNNMHFSPSPKEFSCKEEYTEYLQQGIKDNFPTKES